MATVRITEDLTKSIVENAKGLYIDRIRAAQELPEVLNTKEVYNIWLDSEVGLRDDLEVCARRGWTVSVGQIRIMNLNGKSVDFHTRASPGNERVNIPHNLTGYGAGMKLTGIAAQNLYAAYEHWKEQCESVENSRNEFISNIKALLQRHSTLKQALTEWSALWDLLPSDTKDRYNAEKVRSAGAKRERIGVERPTVDLDVLNGAVVTAKILKGFD